MPSALYMTLAFALITHISRLTDNCKRQQLQNNNKYICIECVDGYHMDNRSVCLPCGKLCMTCQSASICDICYQGHYRSSDGLCMPCDVGCQSCTSSTTCHTCLHNYTLTNSICKKQSDSVQIVFIILALMIFFVIVIVAKCIKKNKLKDIG